LIGQLPRATCEQNCYFVSKSNQTSACPQNCVLVNQTQVAAHLLTAPNAADVPNGQSKCQRCYRSDSRLCHQQLRFRMQLRRLFHGLVEFCDLLVQLVEQPQQIFPPSCCPTFERKLSRLFLPLTEHSFRFFCRPRLMAKCCSPFLTLICVAHAWRKNSRRAGATQHTRTAPSAHRNAVARMAQS